MVKYEFFVAGRWRNQDEIMRIVQLIRDAGFTAFCFIENNYSDVVKELGLDDEAQKSKSTEKLPLDHPLVKAVFDQDMEGQNKSRNFLLVLPAGLSAHMEAGIAYGKGMPCYAIGVPEKTESLYLIFKDVFQDSNEFMAWLAKKK